MSTTPFASRLFVALTAVSLTLAALLLSACAPAKTPPAAAHLNVTGRVEKIETAAWTIAGQVLAVGPETWVIGALRVGDTVRAEARRRADGSLVLRTVKIDPRPAAAQAAAGVVEECPLAGAALNTPHDDDDRDCDDSALSQ